MAVPVALLGLLPVGYVVVESATLGWAGLGRALWRPRVGELLGNTVALTVLGVLGCLLVGLAAAWLVERTDLVGRRLLAGLLVAPLAVPAFVNGYAWASLWPRFEGLPAAVVVTVLSYYPFVYLTVAGALRGLDPALEESAAALGLGPGARFVRVVLPQLRPALLGGGLLVGLHLLAEFGAVQMIGYETFTVVILVQYQSSFGGSTAALLSAVLVLLCLLLVGLETLARGRRRYARVGSGAARAVLPTRLGVLRGPLLLAPGALLVLAVGVPAFAIVRWWSLGPQLGPELAGALWSTLRLGLWGALLTTAVALPSAWLVVRRAGWRSELLERSVYLTSALPGVVVALSLVVVTVRWTPPLYQTTALVVLAYLMLFLPRALVNLRAGLLQVPPELDVAARALGAGRPRRLFRVTLPLLAPGLAGAASFVFLAVCTELTATLLLAPTGTTTLANRFWTYSDSLDYTAAAPFAATMVLISTPLALLMLQQSRRVRGR